MKPPRLVLSVCFPTEKMVKVTKSCKMGKGGGHCNIDTFSRLDRVHAFQSAFGSNTCLSKRLQVICAGFV